MIKTVQIRIIAPDERSAELAIKALQQSVDTARVVLTTPRKGRKGDEYLTYGTLQIGNETSVEIVAPALAATGDTTRLAATGKTQRRRRTR